MATTKDISESDKKTTRSFLNQLIDVLQQDISSSVSRRKYQVFVTGGVGPGVTSSLFQTVYDQDFTLQTANPIFDITFGLAAPDAAKGTDNPVNNAGTPNAAGIAGVASTGKDVTGKYLYRSSSLMMREKTDIYSQFSQMLLGNRSRMFRLPKDATFTTDITNQVDIDAAVFIAFKRLFARDQIKRETFAMRFYQSASYVDKTFKGGTGNGDEPSSNDADNVPNLFFTSTTGSTIYTDIGSSDSRFFEVGGQYGYLVDASAVSRAVGLMFYDSGIAVLDASRITSGSQFISGTISAMHPLGKINLGGPGTETAFKAKVIPDLVVSASIDDIVDHFCYARFGDSNLTAITFQNVTNINSSLVFCRALPDDFNYSSNPTYIDSKTDSSTSSVKGRLTIYDPALPEESQDTFTYITTIGLYDNDNGLLAVAKLSRPVEKNPGRDLTFRVRLDF
ncbi:MAG: hypothetical protein EBR82_00600 [Caulobacteraceae bacterium]|nr:hypothetical protein [Caulobacteraceae bacterium]